MRRVRESDVYFERCHGADLDRTLSLQAKYACWETWLDEYAEGQPPHRILYARERMVALAYGEPLSASPESSLPEGASVATDTAPDTTGVDGGTAIAPTATEASGPRTSPVPRNPRYRGNPTCEPVCAPPWRTCLARCVEGRDACVRACESEYRACMRGCL
jgi:hypothetical protein